MREGKYVVLVIEAFINLYWRGCKARITCYGGTEERLEELGHRYDLIPTIQFKGIVDEVPYHLHQCYLSASFTELFANACVEALNQGLLALLSDVEIAHRFYAEQSDAIRLFRNKAQLIQMIEEMEQADYRQSNAENIALAAHYSLGTVAQSYRELLDRNF